MAKRKNEYIESNVDILDLDSSIIKTFKENDINTVGQVWVQTRKTLKTLGLKDSDIKQVIIKLQLLGLDLNKKIYS